MCFLREKIEKKYFRNKYLSLNIEVEIIESKCAISKYSCKFLLCNYFVDSVMKCFQEVFDQSVTFYESSYSKNHDSLTKFDFDSKLKRTF